MQLDPAEESLQTAEGLYEQRDLANAEKAFKKVFEQTADKSMHGRAYYGLALLLPASKDWAKRRNYSNAPPTTTLTPPLQLGRMSIWDASRWPVRILKKQTNEQFKTALAINGISAMARDAAEKGSGKQFNDREKQQ